MTKMRVAALGFAGLLLAGCAADGAYRPYGLDAIDRQQISAVTQDALEFNPTGEGSNWANSATGHRGTVTPIRTDDDAVRPCRRFQQTASISGRTRIAYDTACRDARGGWHSVTYADLSGAIASARRPHMRPYYRHYYGHHHGPYHGPYYGYPRHRVGIHFGHFPRHRHFGHHGHYW